MAFFECNVGGGGGKVAYGTSPTITTSFQEIDCGFVPDEIWVYCYNSSNKGGCYRYILGTSSSTAYGLYKSTSSTSGIDDGISNENVTKGINGFKFKAGNTSSIFYNKPCRYVAFKYND